MKQKLINLLIDIGFEEDIDWRNKGGLYTFALRFTHKKDNMVAGVFNNENKSYISPYKNNDYTLSYEDMYKMINDDYKFRLRKDKIKNIFKNA